MNDEYDDDYEDSEQDVVRKALEQGDEWFDNLVYHSEQGHIYGQDEIIDDPVEEDEEDLELDFSFFYERHPRTVKEEHPMDTRTGRCRNNPQSPYDWPPKFALQFDEFKLPGRGAIEAMVNGELLYALRNPWRFQSLVGQSFPGNILFEGPPGCGKTFAVEQIANIIGFPVFRIDSGTVASPYIHDTGKMTKHVFTRAKEHAPSILIIDELDSWCSQRDDSHIHHTEEVGVFLQELQEANSNKVLVFGMTNHIEVIDSAVRRSGRFDKVIHMGYPSDEEIRSILQFSFAHRTISSDICLNRYIPILRERPISDIIQFSRNAGLVALRCNKDCVDSECFDIVAEMVLGHPLQAERRPIGFMA